MSLSGIISVTGKPGLHKIISNTKNGLIVESLIDGRRMPVYSTQRVSALEDISMYTQSDEIPLQDILKRIFDHEKGKAALSHKSEKSALRDYLETVVPDYDRDRVYDSDIAKLIQWYNILVDKSLLNFDEEEKSEEEAIEEEKKAPAPKKKSGSASKKTSATKKAASGDKK